MTIKPLTTLLTFVLSFGAIAEESAPKEEIKTIAPAEKKSSEMEKVLEAIAPPRVELYTMPGIVGKQNGVWVGSDNLFNLTDKIGIEIEIVKPDSATLKLDEVKIEKTVANIFESYGITPSAEIKRDKAPLPFFNIFIMVHVMADRWIVYCSGRLFEPVKLARVHLDPSITFQAITWEKQQLIIASEAEAELEIRQAINEITASFGQRVDFFRTVNK